MKDSDKLAREFCKVLREWLTPEEMLEVAERNRVEDRPGVCHSHDFCDANMAMLEAAKNLGYVIDDEDISDETFSDGLWNEAWDKASESGFTL